MMLPPPVDVSHYFGRCRQRVHRLGVELEGLWTALPEHVQVQRDASVRFEHEFLADTDLEDIEPTQIGELSSSPLTIEEFPAWIRQWYPTRVNDTCGLHVHMSFQTPLIYHRLMDPTYQSTVIAAFDSWARAHPELFSKDHPIWPRLRGDNQYCRHAFYADEQVQMKSKEYTRGQVGCRYTAINYCWRLKTVECRLLPMMPTAEIANAAIHHLLDVTAAWLVATKPSHTTRGYPYEHFSAQSSLTSLAVEVSICV